MNSKKRPDQPDALRSVVSEGYARIAETGCGCACGSGLSAVLGYAPEELAVIPAGADLGLGCGNPVALSEARPGETVLDLGSGAGMDVFLVAPQVGPTGRVIGVDMTPAMLEKARANAAQVGATNVEFREGFIEALPVDDASVDLILSNCVINLSPEKNKVFAEAWRVLRPGGRMVVSDLVLEEALPTELAERIDATIGCVGNASLRQDYLATARAAGFTRIEILKETAYGTDVAASSPLAADAARETGLSLEDVAAHFGKVVSLTLRLTRPD